MSRRFLSACLVLQAAALAVASVWGSPVDAAPTICLVAVCGFGLRSLQAQVDRLSAAATVKVTPAVGWATMTGLLLKMPLIGLLVWWAYRLGTLSLVTGLVGIVSVYSAFVWDVVARPVRSSGSKHVSRD
ncbi:MAG: hypothetical protein MH204_07345 [Fimbriimonadaceae bacterium]|nr:hypothetical protein [Fimbriimonadaceae bacterium]